MPCSSRIISEIVPEIYTEEKGWSGGVMVLGKLPLPGRPAIWIIIGQGPIAVGGCLDISFPLILPLSGRRPDID